MGDSAANPPIDPSHPRVGPEELIDDRYLLDAFLENTPDHVYFKDHESRFIRISRALATWMGLADPLEAVGRTDFRLLRPGPRARGLRRRAAAHANRRAARRDRGT